MLPKKYRNHVFNGKKSQPSSTFLIITKNNEAELESFFLNILKEQKERKSIAKMVIFDCFSFDRTLDIIESYKPLFEWDVVIRKKTTSIMAKEQIKMFMDSPLVQIFNFMKLNQAKETHYSLRRQQNWLDKLLVTNTKDYIINMKLVNEIIQREHVTLHYHIIEKIVEPLTHYQMILQDDSFHSSDKGEARQQLIDEIDSMITQLKLKTQNINPTLFNPPNLYTNIMNYNEEFTERTQIKTILKERGQEKELDHLTGLSIMRCVHSFYQILEKSIPSTITIHLDWRVQLFIKISVKKEASLPYSLSELNEFINEKLILIEGEGRVKAKDNSLECMMVIPINEAKREGYDADTIKEH